jgi:hypothetical protein
MKTVRLALAVALAGVAAFGLPASPLFTIAILPAALLFERAGMDGDR